MSGAYLFLLTILAFVGVYFIWAFGRISVMKEYFKTKAGKRVLSGVIVFILSGALVVVISEVARADIPKGTWFNYGEVFLGVDWTYQNPSPQCKDDGPDSRGTSNGGIRFNIYESYDKRFHFNTKYTHHSCALNSDRNQYDAIGFEINYRFFSR